MNRNLTSPVGGVFFLGWGTRADASAADKTPWTFYWIDVEGGSSVLLVTPAR